ncbi:MAG: hypothetical protein H6719_33210 [Sandaracinaceae bacterium]|nr:hypothetical protein [Sandaracinaceae bacterium]
MPAGADIPPGGQGGILGVPGDGPLTSLVGARSFRCRLQRDGHARCRGLALLTPHVPDEVFTEVVVGSRFACGLTEAGRARCVTSDGPAVALDGGPLSRARGERRRGVWAASGRRRPRLLGVASARGSDVRGLVSLSIGNTHGCGLRPDGGVACWGCSPTG